MLLHAFPSMFLSLLHATSWISGKLCLQTCVLKDITNYETNSGNVQALVSTSQSSFIYHDLKADKEYDMKYAI